MATYLCSIMFPFRALSGRLEKARRLELPDVVVHPLPGKPQAPRELARRGRFPGKREQPLAKRMQERARALPIADALEIRFRPICGLIHRQDYLS